MWLLINYFNKNLNKISLVSLFLFLFLHIKSYQWYLECEKKSN